MRLKLDLARNRCEDGELWDSLWDGNGLGWQTSPGSEEASREVYAAQTRRTAMIWKMMTPLLAIAGLTGMVSMAGTGRPGGFGSSGTTGPGISGTTGNQAPHDGISGTQTPLTISHELKGLSRLLL